MKKFTCCFILLLFSIYTHAQSSQKLDSLKKVLAKLPKEGGSFAGDTMRVRVLVEMGEEEENFDSLKFIFNNAINISQKIEWSEGLYLANFKYALKAGYNGFDFLAIDIFFKALSASEKVKNPEKTGLVYRRLGDEYLIIEDFSRAEIYYKKALQYLKNKRAYLMSLNNLGLVYYNKKEFQKALKVFEKCLRENKETDNRVFDTYCLGNIGACYKSTGDFEKSLKYFKLNQNLENSIDDFALSDKIYTIVQLSELYLLKKDLKNAHNEIHSAENKANEVDKYTQTFIFDVAYKINKASGNNKKALEYYEKYVDLKETSTKQDYKRRISGLQFEYENEKQRANIETLNTDIIQKELIGRFLLFGLLLIGIFFIIQYRNNNQLKNKNLQIEQQKNDISELNQNLEIKVQDRTKELVFANEELLRKNEEIMSALVEGQTIERKRVAVELHDNLGSMLSGMKWRLQALNKDKLSEKEQKVYEGILTMMGDAYSEVRLISHNLLPAELEKSGLQGALQKLANDINQSEKLQISINFDVNDSKIDKKTELELYGICMEMVNNILKHSEATVASINLYRQNDSLNLQIIDNGIGLIADVKNSGMGAKNIFTRLTAISGKLNQLKLEKGTGYLIEVPIQI